MHSHTNASSESQPSLRPADSFMDIFEVTLCWVMLNTGCNPENIGRPQAMCPV